jgi:hypothetical protein
LRSQSFRLLLSVAAELVAVELALVVALTPWAADLMQSAVDDPWQARLTEQGLLLAPVEYRFTPAASATMANSETSA